MNGQKEILKLLIDKACNLTALGKWETSKKISNYVMNIVLNELDEITERLKEQDRRIKGEPHE